MSDIMIKAEGLCKYYGHFKAVENVSFTIRRGETVAFLGPNGAGKSTTMKLLSGFISPSSGSSAINGFSMQSQRLEGAAELGYLPENGPLYPDLTPSESLDFTAAMRGLSGAEAAQARQRVISICHLEEVLHKPIAKLSKGYRQRVGMAQALIHDPQVLILDEPTSGLDPNQIRTVRDTVRELAKSRTILLSTHILQEVKAMCSRVIFINEGRLAFDGPADEFLARGSSPDEVFHAITQSHGAAR